AVVTISSCSWSSQQSELLHARFLQTHGRTIANAEIHDAAGSEPDESAIRGQLHPVNELALPIDDIVNGPAIDVLTGSDPEIAVGVGAGRTRRERGLVVRQIARRNHCEGRQASSDCCTARTDRRYGRIATGCCSHRSRL